MATASQRGKSPPAKKIPAQKSTPDDAIELDKWNSRPYPELPYKPVDVTVEQIRQAVKNAIKRRRHQ